MKELRFWYDTMIQDYPSPLYTDNNGTFSSITTHVISISQSHFYLLQFSASCQKSLINQSCWEPGSKYLHYLNCEVTKSKNLRFFYNSWKKTRLLSFLSNEFVLCKGFILKSQNWPKMCEDPLDQREPCIGPRDLDLTNQGRVFPTSHECEGTI